VSTESTAALIRELEGVEAVLDFWEEVINQNQLLHRPHFHRARLFLKAGNYSQAKNEIEKALELAPDNRVYLKLQKQIENQM